MSSDVRLASSTGGLDIEIDRLCDRFEGAWKSGETPRVEAFVALVDAGKGEVLLRELLRVELEMRKNRGESPRADEYTGRFPTHTEMIGNLLESLDRELAVTIHSPRPAERSGGLNVRCPHCSNRIELVSDATLESISCGSCGSNFSLVNSAPGTREAHAVTQLGQFELVERLGMGAFGSVWKARDTQLDRTVAVKIPRKGGLSPEEAEKFFREARSAAQLRHPHIVPVYEVGRHEDTIYIVCELVRGVSLSDWLTGHPPHSREVSRICKVVANALHHAHEAGVIHRDLKPQNIMMDEEGLPHLMDFGLAKREANEVTMTVDGQILGTPAYMSPEQAGGRGHWTDRRSDIYSLGVLMFHMLTGETPFRGNAQMQVHQRLIQDPPDPRKLNRHLPRDLSTICLKCLERDPNRRYATAREVADELERHLSGLPVRARPISHVARSARWCRRNPAIAAVAALTAVLAVAGPLAAWRIEVQRKRLEGLVVEKDHLIEQAAKQHQASINQISHLTGELSTWRGRANPWDLWPPQRGEGPRQTLLQRAYDRHYASMRDRIRNDDSIAPHSQVAAEVGLALLADCTGHKTQAIRDYEAACESLEGMLAETPAGSMLLRELAECYVQLSRLYGSERKAETLQSLEKASEFYHRLAESSESTRDAIALVDTEMRRAVFVGFEEAAEQLAEATHFTQSFDKAWPTAPDKFYQAVCALCDREPILALPTR